MPTVPDMADKEKKPDKKRVHRRLMAILAADVAGYSRLMGTDEEGTLARLNAHRRELVDRRIKKYRGHIIKTTGDGMLVEFASAVDAVQCAVDIQRGMVERNAGVPLEDRIEFRVGINVGDIIEDKGDIFGDGVNVAARLESIAVRGGICISQQVVDQIEGKLKLQCRELGRQNLKNISRPIEVYSVNLDEGGSAAARVLTAANLKQDIRYCRAADGVRLAYAKVGTGPPLLRSAHWLGHLEYDWELPILRHFLLGLASAFSLTRYDARGNGLSDWDVGEVSLDAWVNDMETVAEAAGLHRFPLLGVSQGCAVSIAFAVRHPERVTHLILFGGFATGVNKNPNLTPADRERFAAMKTLMKLGWGSDDPTFRQLFTSSMIPEATKEQADAFNELQRVSASPECAVRYIETVSDFDVRHLLPKVKAPTLVMHVRDDRRVPIASSRELAAGIPGARFVGLPGKNHIVLEQDAGGPVFLEELRSFLGVK
jgi:class 3 adenylate cyclase/pimeloyl-ACP methyl ester carboxylesterase